MNRRAAIAALLAAAPAMAMEGKIMWSDSSALSAQPMMVIGPRGEITIHLEAVKCLWVTLGSDAIEISAAELFDALKPMPQASSYDWLIVDRPMVKP